jgi:peptide subunit release factor 1 (eRF1)
MRSETNSTDMITMYIPAGRERTEVSKLLGNEYSTSRNIRDRVCRGSVERSLKSCL